MTLERLAEIKELAEKGNYDGEFIRASVAHTLRELLAEIAALEERLQSESTDRRLIAEALDRVAKEKIALEERLRQAEVELRKRLPSQTHWEGRLLTEVKSGETFIVAAANSSKTVAGGMMRQEQLAKPADEPEAELKAKDEQIRSLEAELLELNDAYKRTRLASAEKHEQIRLLREALIPVKRDFCKHYCHGWLPNGHVSGCKVAEEALAQTEESKQ